MKKRDSEVVSTSSAHSGASRGSERRKNTRFSLRRIFYVARGGRSRSHVSLDSDSTRSEMSLNLNASAVPTDRITGASAIVLPGTSTASGADSLSLKGEDRECPVCLLIRPANNFPEISTCFHRSCLSCLQIYLRIEITESRVNISCPECAERFHPNDIQKILQNDILLNKYEQYMVRRVLVSEPDTRWCPAPDCGYAVIATGCAGCPKLKCERPGCDTYFCYHCKQYWHPNQTCDAARAERSQNSISGSHETDSQKDDIKPCPRCGAFIMKMNDGSCNHMACPVCGAEFCWLCMKEISDLHYLSPSGCTFWGKKPWSRKKKILWQLGTLVGAPVGISLIAGIAVPAMIIGIPVWVGRKIHSKYEWSSRHRRNLAITGGVVASVIVSPVVAGLAVGIGVPILLAYVYGVVPISLCRSGGCGVRTTNKGGVRFEFDDDTEVCASGGPYTGDAHSVETSHNVANPSIGPSIGDASLGMTNSLSASGSHMDRVGILRDESDRDSASNRAVAGASLNGSLCGSTYAGCHGFQNKLEVQADVSSHAPSGKRASLSSESANFSIGEKSATVSFGDDASTRALAGSIVNYKMDKQDTASVTTAPFDIQVDLISNTSRGRRSSISSLATSCTEKHKIMPSPDSPTSACSGILLGSEDGRSHLSRCRTCKRMSHNEKSSEQTNVHFADEVSLQSFRADDLISTNSAHDNGETTSRSSFPEGEEDICKGILHEKAFSCLSSQSCSKNKCSTVLTEVENDHPLFSKRTFVTSASDSSLDNPRCSRKSLSKSRSEESCATGKIKFRRGRVRHRSCELALEHGRISPKMVE